jgi:hypothetical protein
MSRKLLSAALLLLVIAWEPSPSRAQAWVRSSGYYYPSNYYTSAYYYPAYYYPAYSYAAYSYPAYSYSTYYYTAPVVRYYPAPTIAYSIPAVYCAAPTIVNSTGLAQPTPAPASQYRDPIPDKKDPPRPKVTESRSFSLSMDKTASALEATGKGVCRVGFWNISGRNLELQVNGKTHVLPRDQSLTLMLDRDFNWQVEGQPAQSERIADDKTAHEIVVR